MPNKIQDLSGMTFGFLTPIRHYRKNKTTRWICSCSCGGVKDVAASELKRGSIKSCGCYKKRVHIPRPDLSIRNKENKKHGMHGTRTYRIWNNMKDRCNNKSCKDYRNYGGRGISHDERWNNFVEFLRDMGVAPDSMQLDRIDNNGNYSKENCRWTDIVTQANNRRTNIFVQFQGQEKTIADWARETGIERKTLEYRIRSGWPADKALTTPSLIPRKNKEKTQC